MKEAGRHSYEDFRRPPETWAFLEGEKFIRSALPGWARPVALLEREGEKTSVSGFPQKLILPSKKFKTLSKVQNSQGLLGVFDVGEGPSVSQILDKSPGLLLLLQGVQDPGNVGVIIRTAAALGASGVLADQDSSSPFQDKALRASAGLALAFPCARVGDAASLLKEAGRRGLVRVAAAAHAGSGLPDFPPGTKMKPGSGLMLVLGSEGSGLDPKVTALCDRAWSHPLEGGAESLNVAVATALFLEARRHG